MSITKQEIEQAEYTAKRNIIIDNISALACEFKINVVCNHKIKIAHEKLKDLKTLIQHYEDNYI